RRSPSGRRPARPARRSAGSAATRPEVPHQAVFRAMPIREHDFARIGLFAELPGRSRGNLGDRMRLEQVPMGATVLREGDDGDRFYVVLSGMLSVTQEA